MLVNFITFEHNILAIDNGGDCISVAIHRADGSQRSISSTDHSNRSSMNVLLVIKDLLDECRLKISDINVIVYNEGPGSFTGLRVGLSVALGIAVGIGIGLVAIPSFHILAHAYDTISAQQLHHSSIPYNLFQSKRIMICQTARKRQSYVAGINCSNYEYFLEPTVMELSTIPIHYNCTYVGSGCPIEYGCRYYDLPYPQACHLLDLALIGRYPVISAAQAQIEYLHKKIIFTPKSIVQYDHEDSD
jgi:tRNA threonylcarbamoyl adenosine modification protein YeaZ